jgi:hypothetical protein
MFTLLYLKTFCDITGRPEVAHLFIYYNSVTCKVGAMISKFCT